ncbi:topoisomerase [Carnobacterium divergens]|uniref:Sak single strand annealing protein n=1 Tax=Carnobacterium divergens TaxID=2748 RepID=UPI0010733007|nr:DUF1071 domain-containing protein [Carnobacterium divergens]TFI93069.1 topoisomerase [Carnobacterium divergens]
MTEKIFTKAQNEIFNELYQIDVNQNVEQKNKLNYLSWAWAWAEVSKRSNSVSYVVERDPQTNLPYYYDPNTGYMVFTKVTIDGFTHEMWLPVMDGSNKAMKAESYTYQVKKYEKYKWTGEYEDKKVEAATMFDINKAIMRCLVKNLAMFGIGLYIFAGEDMPEDVTMFEPAPERNKKIFIKTIEEIAANNNVSLDKAIEMLTETAKVTADDSKWTRGDLGLLKRGTTWLKDQLEAQKKEKSESE